MAPDSHSPDKPRQPFRFWTVLGALLVVLSGLGVAGYLLYPRTPTYVASFDLSKGAHIKLRSENYIDWTVKRVQCWAYFQGEKLMEGEARDFVVKAQRESELLLPVSLFLSPAAVEHCANSTHIPVKLHIDIDLALISWTGKRIRIAKDVSIACPAEARSLATTPNLLRKVRRHLPPDLSGLLEDAPEGPALLEAALKNPKLAQLAKEHPDILAQIRRDPKLIEKYRNHPKIAEFLRSLR